MGAATSCEHENGVTAYLLTSLSTQFFIILHGWEFVGWTVHKVTKGRLGWVRVGSTGFHEVIGFNYRAPESGSASSETSATELLLARGYFHSSSFLRTLTYNTKNHTYQLPYKPREPQQGDVGFIATGPAYYPQYAQSSGGGSGSGSAPYSQSSYGPVSWSQY